MSDKVSGALIYMKSVHVGLYMLLIGFSSGF